MFRRLIRLPQIASWDLVVTSSGVNILVVPDDIHVNRIIAAEDGIVMDGMHPTHLYRSARAVPYVRRDAQLILVQAGNGRTTEKVVRVVNHEGTIAAGRHHEESRTA